MQNTKLLSQIQYSVLLYTFCKSVQTIVRFTLQNCRKTNNVSWLTEHALHQTSHKVFQQCSFTGTLKLTFALCEGPKSHKPDIA